jgi:hypothetical protein
MQYFIGYSSFSDEEPFDPSLFVDFRKRLGIEQINAINEKILGLGNIDGSDNDNNTANKTQDTNTPDEDPLPNTISKDEIVETSKISHKGTLIADATACPQDIAYPTDLNLLSDAREKSEELIDVLYNAHKHTSKPRTYREIARQDYLHTAQKKVKTKKEIRKALRKQLNYLNRNLKSIHTLLDAYQTIPLDRYQYKYLLVIQTLYAQ